MEKENFNESRRMTRKRAAQKQFNAVTSTPLVSSKLPLFAPSPITSDTESVASNEHQRNKKLSNKKSVSKAIFDSGFFGSNSSDPFDSITKDVNLSHLHIQTLSVSSATEKSKHNKSSSGNKTLDFYSYESDDEDRFLHDADDLQISPNKSLFSFANVNNKTHDKEIPKLSANDKLVQEKLDFFGFEKDNSYTGTVTSSKRKYKPRDYNEGLNWSTPDLMITCMDDVSHMDSEIQKRRNILEKLDNKKKMGKDTKTKKKKLYVDKSYQEWVNSMNEDLADAEKFEFCVN